MFRSWLVIVFASLGMVGSPRVLAQTAAPGPAGVPSSRATSGKAQTTPKPPSPAPGQLSDEAELARIAGLYEAAKYRDCSAEIERLLDPTAHRTLRQTGVVENARVYWAACLLGAGEGDAADAPLRAAIHENPQMKPPDSLVFPQPVVERFLKVRDSLVNEIRAAEQARIVQAQREAQRRVQSRARELDRMRELEKLAAKETLIQRNSRAIAAIPFGVGQFQNREPALGYTFLISEALLGGLSFTAVVLQSKLATEASRVQRGGQAVDDVQQESNQRTLGALKTGGFWAFAALAIGGIVQAQIAYVPEFREERPRKLPPSLSPTTSTPEVSAIPFVDKTGGGLNVVGRF